MDHLKNPIFQDEAEARKWLEVQIWPDGPVCPHCRSDEPTKLAGEAHREGLYQCNECRQQFTVTVGTVFERSKIALTKWLLAVYLLSSSKKGMSTNQLSRTLGLPYKTAWFMTHRIREAMKGGKSPLGGPGKTVEGFFSIFKRGMKSIYQHCGEQHLQHYLTEFDFRYSYRVKLGYSDLDRAIEVLKGVVGKRLTYRSSYKAQDEQAISEIPF